MSANVAADDDGDRYDDRPTLADGTRQILYVNVYAVERHYGGPEEGGWWFNAGEPLASVPISGVWEDGSLGPLDEAECGKERARLAELFEGVAHGKISSVLGGVELHIEEEDHMAEYWPKHRPHYE